MFKNIFNTPESLRSAMYLLQASVILNAIVLSRQNLQFLFC